MNQYLIFGYDEKTLVVTVLRQNLSTFKQVVTIKIVLLLNTEINTTYFLRDFTGVEILK